MNPNAGTTKILVSAALFTEILERQPEIELELVRNAVPQIATMLAARAQQTKAQVEERVRKAWDEIVRQRSDRYGMPAEAKRVVRDFLEEACREEARNLLTKEAERLAREEAQKAVSSALLKLGQDLQKAVARSKEEVDEYIKETAEREVLALLRAGRLTVTPE